jgi:FAD/FMN-containing dehydrogenase
LHSGTSTGPAIKVVLPDGRVWDGLRGLRKDNTGYDLNPNADC